MLTPAGAKVTAEYLSEDYAQADAINHTANTGSYEQLSSIYTIPAGDAVPGANNPTAVSYRLTCWGHGSWGNGESLAFQVQVGASACGTVTFAGGLFSNGANIRWKATALLVVNQVGASGNVVGGIDVDVAQIANNINPGTAADNSASGPGSTNGGIAMNTTVPNSFGIYAEWGGTTGSPTLTCDATIYEKLGG